MTVEKVQVVTFVAAATMMMKTSLLAFLSLLSGALGYYSPVRISYNDLVRKNGPETKETNENDGKILSALRGVGMVSVTNVADSSFSFPKMDTLSSLLKCMEQSSSIAVGEHVFSDGTVRRTLATHTQVGLIHPIHHDGATACDGFDEASLAFRKTVDSLTNAFAVRLEELTMTHGHETPLLKSIQHDKDYFDIPSIARSGMHLEHFHVYQPSAGHHHEDNDDKTIEWHIDQGLFLVFTPGLIDSEPSDGFYIQLPDGTQEMVQFEDQDDLVIILGDGVNQILNPALQANQSLRALPHSFVMPRDTQEQPRVWYGRMVLPPSDALHPVYHQMTYGQLREQMMMDHHHQEDALTLGCSSSTMHARHLDEADCEVDTQFFCWHRCFNLTEDLNATTCQADGLDLACINEERQLWNGAHNASFSPGCVDLDTAVVAPNSTTDGGDEHAGHNHTATSASSSSAGVAMWSSVALGMIVSIWFG